MDNNKEFKLNSENSQISEQNQMKSTVEQVAFDELEKTRAKLVCGRSIDRGDPEDDDEYVQSDDEDMMEEIVTTVEEDKDLECKIKKKVETKKTVAQHPDTHDTVTKVVKTEVTEITRTITINDHHDLERAKRELGIDDVHRLLPLSSSLVNRSTLNQVKEKHDEPTNEIITTENFSSDNRSKQIHPEERPVLAESTTVGRGPVTETVSSSSQVSQQKTKLMKKKKKKSKLCSCTRSTDAEYGKQNQQVNVIEQKTAVPAVTKSPVESVIDTQIEGQPLISPDVKQLIIDKKSLLLKYIHSKIFFPSKLFTSNEEDIKATKVSSRILDLLRYDRCSSWTQMFEQLKDEYADYLSANSLIQPMLHTYESLFTSKQSNLLNTFATIHSENDIKNIQENNDYISIVQKHINERDNQLNIEIVAKQSIDNVENKNENLQQNVQEKSIDKGID